MMLLLLVQVVGMTAALQAKEAGMNPVILEKCLLQVGIQLNRLQE